MGKWVPGRPQRTGKPTGRPPMPDMADAHVYMSKAQYDWLGRRAHRARKNRSWAFRQIVDHVMNNPEASASIFKEASDAGA
jgi:hypothetical protein